MRQLRAMDAFYFRFEGQPLCLPRWLRAPWRWLLGRKPWVWEVESTGELRAAGAADATADHARQRQVRWQARRVALALCITENITRYAQDIGIRNTRVVPNGADPDVFRPDVPASGDAPANPGGLNVVWSGSATVGWHDFGTLFRAAQLLADEPRIRFYLLSSQPPPAERPPNVIYLGQRDYPQMPSVLAGMDVGLCIYRRETWTRYGTFSSPLKLFEYLAMGLIVVASPIEQARACLTDGESGFITSFEDSQALAAVLRAALARKAQLAGMRERARRLVLDYYNWDRAARETADAIMDILGRPRSLEGGVSMRDGNAAAPYHGDAAESAQ
jgi:glycosyltransferase involved in cell wall biosynthesis